MPPRAPRRLRVANATAQRGRGPPSATNQARMAQPRARWTVRPPGSASAGRHLSQRDRPACRGGQLPAAPVAPRFAGTGPQQPDYRCPYRYGISDARRLLALSLIHPRSGQEPQASAPTCPRGRWSATRCCRRRSGGTRPPCRSRRPAAYVRDEISQPPDVDLERSYDQVSRPRMTLYSPDRLDKALVPPSARADAVLVTRRPLEILHAVSRHRERSWRGCARARPCEPPV